MEEDEESGPPKGPLIALVVIVVLVVGGLWLTHKINAMSTIQDCVASGRTNCASVTN